MHADIIDGKQIAADIRKEIAVEVEQLQSQTGKVCFLPLSMLCTYLQYSSAVLVRKIY